MGTKDDGVIPAEVEGDKTARFMPTPGLLREATPPSVRITTPAVPVRDVKPEADGDSLDKAEATTSARSASDLHERVTEKDIPEQ